MDIGGYMMASPEKILPSRNRMTHVNFTCQRCSQPLKLDSSFRDLDEQTLCDLTAHHILNSDSDNGHDAVQAFQKTWDAIDVSKKLILPVRYTGTGNGFMVVGESLSSCVDNSSNKTLEVTAALFDLMSDKSDIDHPICEECTDNLLDKMDQQLKIAEDECKEYREFLEQLDGKNEEEDLEKLESELKKIAEEEKLLISELCEVEKKEQKLKKELRNYEEEYEQLCQEEDMYWQEYSSLKRQLLLFEEDQHSVENHLCYAKAQLTKLNETNVFNATFHIWHNDHFGTINNFRLGRLPSAPVDWPEINAAWGQTVLLLNSLAKKIGLTFKDYRLVPYGNHSYIEILNKESNKLPLHCSGGFKFLWNDKFDQGMVAFLDCLQQFEEKAQSTDVAFHFPYKMEKGKLYDAQTKKSYFIKMRLNSEEGWTKALKFMLTNLKWGLAWVSSQYAKT